jgi:Transposase
MIKQQVEVITSVQRRRHWSREEKERIVAAALEPGTVASEIARAAGIHASQLFRWRQQLCQRTPAPATFHPIANWAGANGGGSCAASVAFATDHLPHRPPAAAGLTDDLLDRHSAFRQRQDRSVGLFPAQIAFILDALGRRQQLGIDPRRADDAPTSGAASFSSRASKPIAPPSRWMPRTRNAPRSRRNSPPTSPSPSKASIARTSAFRTFSCRSSPPRTLAYIPCLRWWSALPISKVQNSWCSKPSQASFSPSAPTAGGHMLEPWQRVLGFSPLHLDQ